MAEYRPPHPSSPWAQVWGLLVICGILLLAVIVYLAATGCWSNGERDGPGRPVGVTDYGWDNWRQLSEEEQRLLCATMRNVFAIEANAARVAIESGAALPARAAEPAETEDMRLLCNVPAPNYQQMRSDWVRQEAQEKAERELLVRDRYDKMYRALAPLDRTLLCISFKSVGDDRFTYSRDALAHFVTRTGWEPVSGAEDVKHLEAVCRRHRDR